MNILVTGATWITLSKNHQVSGIDNFLTGKFENLSNIINSNKFKSLRYN